MGRKIPGKKHKGVKDPLIQKAVREEKLKTQINAPPVNPDQQEIPKSLENIMRLKKIAADSKYVQKRKKQSRNKLVEISKIARKEFKLPGMKVPDKPLPNLSQWHGETEETFLKRIDEATQSLINEVEFEQQFGVHVRRNSDTGDVEDIEMAQSNEIDILMKQKNKKIKDMEKKKKKNVKKGIVGDTPFLNSKQRKKLKALDKKQQRCFESDEKVKLSDDVKFGEVVHQPPVITVRPKNAKKIEKPGVRGNLLLQNMLSNNNNNNVDSYSYGSRLNKNSSNHSKKFRPSNMSPLARQRHEEQRSNVVELYRRVKLQNSKKLH